MKAELEKFPEDVRDDVVILFSAHSLPLKVSLLEHWLKWSRLVSTTICRLSIEVTLILKKLGLLYRV